MRPLFVGNRGLHPPGKGRFALTGDSRSWIFVICNEVSSTAVVAAVCVGGQPRKILPNTSSWWPGGQAVNNTNNIFSETTFHRRFSVGRHGSPDSHFSKGSRASLKDKKGLVIVLQAVV